MNTIVKISITVFFLSFYFSSHGQVYKHLMTDNNVNFYDVCTEAEKYFVENSKGKGSGWKPYQRWKNANEYRFYPSGDRSKVDPSFVRKAFEVFLQKSQQSKFKNSIVNSGWQEIGPFGIDSISPTAYSVGLGRLEDVYADPVDGDIMYVCSNSGGFWRSFDGGENWEGNMTDDLPVAGVGSIAVNPNQPDSILIVSRNPLNGYFQGVYGSSNAGANWQMTPFTPEAIFQADPGSGFRVDFIYYHPLSDNVVFAATTDGLYRSNDDLQTWDHLFSGQEIRQVEFHPTDPNIIYVSAFPISGFDPLDHIYISTNGGADFTLSNAVTGDSEQRISIMRTSPVCPSCLFVSTWYDGLMLSQDNGLTFQQRNADFPSPLFEVSDMDTSKFVCGYLRTYASSDGAHNFVQTSDWYMLDPYYGGLVSSEVYDQEDNYIHADIRQMNSVNGVLYVTTDGFMCKSSDFGFTWERMTDAKGIGIRENYRMAVSQSNDGRFIVGSVDNGTTIKLEETWMEFLGGDGMEGVIHPLNSDWMIGCYQSGQGLITHDAGQTITGGLPGGGPWVTPILFDPNDHMTIFDFRGGVKVRKRFGVEFQSRAGILSSNGSAAAIAENDSKKIIFSAFGALYKSENGGYTVNDISSGLPDHLVQDVVFDPLDDERAIVTFGQYEIDSEKIFLTNDGGLTWENITYNLGDVPIHSVAIDHTDSQNIYVGGEVGVYTKTMDSEVWELFNQDLPNVGITDMEIMYGTNTLRVTTWGRGVWERCIIGREDFPKIVRTTITDPPTDELPMEAMPQWVTSEIHYEDELSNVYLEWSVDEPVFGNQISMTNIGDDSWVSDESLPLYPVNTKMFFKVFAVGANNDTTETYKFMYRIKGELLCSDHFINNPLVQVCPGDDYVFPDGTMTTDINDYVLNVSVFQTTVGGCDSVISTTVAPFNVDLNIVENEEGLFCNFATSNYQWIDCDLGGIPIEGATEQSFIPTYSGSFAVTTTTDLCTLTSNCLPFVYVGIDEINNDSEAYIYPNPTSGIVNINCEIEGAKRIEVYDNLGRRILNLTELYDKELVLNLSGLANGKYMVKLFTEEVNQRFEVLLEQ